VSEFTSSGIFYFIIINLNAKLKYNILKKYIIRSIETYII
jgi:hypothetical protein